MHFEFADSEVAQCNWHQDRLVLRFSAARLVQTLDGRRIDQAMWAPLELTAEQVDCNADWQSGAYTGRLRQGFVLYASQRVQRLPVPCALQGIVTMELEFAQGTVLHIRSHGLHIQPLQSLAIDAYQC